MQETTGGEAGDAARRELALPNAAGRPVRVYETRLQMATSRKQGCAKRGKLRNEPTDIGSKLRVDVIVGEVVGKTRVAFFRWVRLGSVGWLPRRFGVPAMVYHVISGAFRHRVGQPGEAD